MLVLLVRGFPRHISDRRALLIIFMLGISARLFFLGYPPNPDIYRYIWEGIIQNHGFNPYAVAPDDPMVAHLAQGEWRGLVAGVNHRWMTAIYPPAAMLMFRLLAWISPTVIWFKTVFLILDLGVMTDPAGADHAHASTAGFAPAGVCGKPAGHRFHLR